MMYVCGSKEQSTEVLQAMEELVRGYLFQILQKATEICKLRNSKTMIVDDVAFQVRKNPHLKNKIRVHMNWKAIRKNIKEETEDYEEQKKYVFLFDPLGEYLDESDYENDDKLQKESLITEQMPQIEYLLYAECKQASFTKRSKKCRDWLMLQSFNVKIPEDVLEIVGFLGFEYIRLVTQNATKLLKNEPKKSFLFQKQVSGLTLLNIYEAVSLNFY